MKHFGASILHRQIPILAMTSTLLCGAVYAQDYPLRPVRIVTASIGGSTDMIARLIAQGLTANLGQQVIVDNRPTGIVPGEIVVKAVPDGHTLLFHGSSLWLMSLLQKMPFDPAKDLVPITLATSTPNIVVVNPAVAAQSIKELIALARAKPGALNYGSGATGAASHLAAELFKHMAGVNIVRVPYKGQGPAVLALLAGEVQVGFASSGSVAGHIRAGRLRALGMTSRKRSSIAPDLPTVAESGLPGYQSSTSAGMFAPLRTPDRLIALLNREIVQTMNRPAVRDHLSREGTEAVGSSPQEFAAAIAAEIESLRNVIRAAGIRTE